jgi:NAD(P)-dependent dehydrogenase (short-subunit alcohol dehydrogenase family)
VSARQRVAVVTGGGGGIGAAIAEELGRAGWFVVTLDPLVTLDGSSQLPEQKESTVGRILAAGGSARASSASVTDQDAVRDLFCEIADEHDGLDAVVNVAGITRQTFFAKGTEEDWLAVIGVHLGGYLSVLGAALPLMVAKGRGTVLGVTSGSGWRAADAGAYSCAKRAVAALTWQLGQHLPTGVTVNAMSPIAATRMVEAALERARHAGRTSGGGLSFLSMPQPEDLGPLGAYLVGERFGWCNGRVLFAGGSEVAVVDEPRLIEVVRSDSVVSLPAVLEAFVPRAFAAAEAKQASEGGGNPRFGPIFDPGAPAPTLRASEGVRSCAIVSDRPILAESITAALSARSVTCHRVDVARGFRDTAEVLASVARAKGPLDAVVVALRGGQPTGSSEEWDRVLAEHDAVIDQIHSDASWARAVADYSADAARPVALVTLTDAVTAGGASRAQASAQLARAAGGATERRVTAYALSIESSEEQAAGPTGDLVAHLLGSPDTASLAGAELVVGTGWIGLRSHPHPIGSVTYGGPELPGWLDATLREIVGYRAGPIQMEN